MLELQSKDAHKRFQGLARLTPLSPILLQMRYLCLGITLHFVCSRMYRKQKCAARECLAAAQSLAVGIQDALVDAVEEKLQLLRALPAKIENHAPEDDE